MGALGPLWKPVKKPTTLDPPVDTRELLLSHSSDPHLSKNKHITNEQCGRASIPRLSFGGHEKQLLCGLRGSARRKKQLVTGVFPYDSCAESFFLVDC